MIILNNITKTFASTIALDHLTLSVNAGEILDLVGPDGAGKTTLLRLMTGAMTNFSGTISVLGSERIEAVKPYLGYVPQKFSLYADLTVMENIDLLGALYGANRQTIQAQAKEILTFTNLWPFRGRLAGKLSGGMKQKLALAAGLMHKPKLLFLDELTTGVDPVARREFWQLLYRLNQEGTTIVAATPYMDEAERCHRVALLYEGRLICCQTPQAMIDAYPYTLLALESAEKNLPILLAGCHMIDIHAFGGKYHLATDDIDRTVRDVTARLRQKGLPMLQLNKAKPSLEDVFVTFMAKSGDEP